MWTLEECAPRLCVWARFVLWAFLASSEIYTLFSCETLTQIASVDSLEDDGFMDVGARTVATGRSKISNIPWPCGSGVKKGLL